jgi:hypothetical protein
MNSLVDGAHGVMYPSGVMELRSRLGQAYQWMNAPAMRTAPTNPVSLAVAAGASDSVQAFNR